MSDTATLEPRNDHAPVLEDEASPMLRLNADQLAERQNEIHRAMESSLQEDLHYGRIPGTPKPTLFKPGAEWLLRYCGYGVDLTDREVMPDLDGRPEGVMYKAEVFIPTPDGHGRQVIAACEGYAGHDEKKWRDAPWNTIMKMAQKRAIVGAALIATGASTMFTQDIEDYEAAQEEKAEKQERQQQEERYSDPDYFRTRFHAMLTEERIDTDEKKAWLRHWYKVESTKDLPESKRVGILQVLDQEDGKKRIVNAIMKAVEREKQAAEGDDE